MNFIPICADCHAEFPRFLVTELGPRAADLLCENCAPNFSGAKMDMQKTSLFMSRKLNSMFHIENNRLIKTTNGQAVPEDEPLFILRGRDALAQCAIRSYIDDQIEAGIPEDRIVACRESLAEFEKFSLEHADRMKNPGITHGK